MQGINHVGLALAAPLAAIVLRPELASLPDAWPAWAGLIIGSLAPDLDGGGTIARPSKWLPDIFPSWIDKAVDRIGLSVSRVVQTLMGHRGGLHWPLWGALLIYGGQRWALPWLVWFGIGFLLHLLGDMLTVQGVPLFGPISKRKISIFPMRTGGKLELVLGSCLWLFVVWQLSIIGLAAAHTALSPLLYRLSLQ